MSPFRTITVLIITLVCLLLVAGCTSPFNPANETGNTTPAVQQSPASYKVTIAQPDGRSRSIIMDTDVYNLGEVVEFSVKNGGSGTLTCLHDPPTFSVKYQTGSGIWATREGTDAPAETNKSSIEPGKSSPAFRFVTTGWEPNRYRIVSDCGVYREFLVRPAPTPVPTICPSNGDKTLRVRINPIEEQYAGKKFSVSGTTNKAAGEELRYLVFTGSILQKDLGNGGEKPLSTRVLAGACGENQWSVDLDVTTPQQYYFMISAGTQNATALMRFTVYPLPPP